MIAKVVILVVGVLVLVQIMVITDLNRQNTDNLEARVQELDRQIKLAESESQAYQVRREKLLQSLKAVPEAILTGLVDPEQKFVDFMDYVRNSSIRELGGKVTISGVREFETDPVPLQKTRLIFEFSFAEAADLEKLFKYLLDQQDFPLIVNDLEIKRTPEKKPQVKLDLSMLIPDVIELSEEIQQQLFPETGGRQS